MTRLLPILFLCLGAVPVPTAPTRPVPMTEVKLAWDASITPGVSYRVYSGPVSGGYTNIVDAGTNLICKVRVPLYTRSYYAVTAYLGGLESDPSDEISYVRPPPVTVLTLWTEIEQRQPLGLHGPPALLRVPVRSWTNPTDSALFTTRRLTITKTNL